MVVMGGNGGICMYIYSIVKTRHNNSDKDIEQ